MPSMVMVVVVVVWVSLAPTTNRSVGCIGAGDTGRHLVIGFGCNIPNTKRESGNREEKG